MSGQRCKRHRSPLKLQLSLPVTIVLEIALGDCNFTDNQTWLLTWRSGAHWLQRENFLPLTPGKLHKVNTYTVFGASRPAPPPPWAPCPCPSSPWLPWRRTTGPGESTAALILAFPCLCSTVRRNWSTQAAAAKLLEPSRSRIVRALRSLPDVISTCASHHQGIFFFFFPRPQEKSPAHVSFWRKRGVPDVISLNGSSAGGVFLSQSLKN